MKAFIITFLSIISITFCGIVFLGYKNPVSPKTLQEIKDRESCAVVHHGNHIYYFRCVNDYFATELSRFLDDHPELEIVTVSGDGSLGNYGSVAVFRPVKK